MQTENIKNQNLQVERKINIQVQPENFFKKTYKWASQTLKGRMQVCIT